MSNIYLRRLLNALELEADHLYEEHNEVDSEEIQEIMVDLEPYINTDMEICLSDNYIRSRISDALLSIRLPGENINDIRFSLSRLHPLFVEESIYTETFEEERERQIIEGRIEDLEEQRSEGSERDTSMLDHQLEIWSRLRREGGERRSPTPE